MPEWFGRVNERLRAPLNAILATIGVTALVLLFQSYKALPTIFATIGHKLSLASTAWFSIMMAVLTWSLPAINALLVRWRRTDLVQNASFGQSTAVDRPGLAVWIYIFAVIKPIVDTLNATSALTYLETNGILDAGLFYVLGIVIYFVMRYRASRAGVDEKMLSTELPPD